MNSSITQTVWHDLPAWTLENDTLRTVIVPELGAKIVSLFDKRNRLEWLVGPGDRPFRRVPYGAVFTDQDMSGWDEMFPTINACDYPGPGDRHGGPLPDHGEVWTLPWSLEAISDGRITLSVEGRALAYRLTRTADYSEADTLWLHYEVINLGSDSMPYQWAAHPQFVCDQEAVVVLPAQITTVFNAIDKLWDWGPGEAQYPWPRAANAAGIALRLDRVGPPSRKLARKFFVLPDERIEWAGLIRQSRHAWLQMQWDTQPVPYFGVWVDEGVYNPESVAALEPMTGFYDSLIIAWNKQRVSLLEPGATHEWTLTVRCGTGDQPFPSGPHKDK